MATITSQGPLWLDNTVIADIVEQQQQQAERARPRLYLDRVPLMPADDEEITAIWTANRYAADIIAPNQAARTVSAGSMQFNVAEIPNVKMGTRLNQSDINRMERLQLRQRAGLAGADAVYLFWDSIVRERREGVLDALNQLACAMLIGSLNYNRLGIQISTNFLMPADLKVLVPTPWANTSATPITDIQNFANTSENTYGWRPDRVTLSQLDFQHMLATDQVKQLSQAYIGIPATTAVNVGDWVSMRNYVGQMLGMALEVDNHVTRRENTDGTPVSIRDLPEGTVLLTRKADDGDDMMFDIANAVLTEAAVAKMAGMDVQLGGQDRGPAVFATAPHELNPPEITVWGCARAFPRRKNLACSGVLTGV
jgi:hypothetical protein